MNEPVNQNCLVNLLRNTTTALVRRDGFDLTSRQLSVFLTCYLCDGDHTIRGLSADLNVSKPAITRVVDRLCEADLTRRKVDMNDMRSVLVQRTLKGSVFLRDLRSIMATAVISVKTRITADDAVSLDGPERKTSCPFCG